MGIEYVMQSIGFVLIHTTWEDLYIIIVAWALGMSCQFLHMTADDGVSVS